ncbi:hypothetical protein [Verrucosispora sp. NA02020]|uniref:hypothetical protein n=1 Tax=Verrucosispora sp. NA02020 TaxID=2742132 RepID=UPI003D713E47
MTHDRIPLGDRLFDQAADRARQIRDARPDETPTTFREHMAAVDYANADARAATAEAERDEALATLTDVWHALNAGGATGPATAADHITRLAAARDAARTEVAQWGARAAQHAAQRDSLQRDLNGLAAEHRSLTRANMELTVEVAQLRHEVTRLQQQRDRLVTEAVITAGRAWRASLAGLMDDTTPEEDALCDALDTYDAAEETSTTDAETPAVPEARVLAAMESLGWEDDRTNTAHPRALYDTAEDAIRAADAVAPVPLAPAQEPNLDEAGYEIVARQLHHGDRGQLVSGHVVASAVSARMTLGEALDELRRIIGPAADEPIRPADWEQQAIDAVQAALAAAWGHLAEDPVHTEQIAITAVRAVIDAGLAGAGGRCRQCGATYPRTLPAGQDPLCWTCDTGEQSGPDQPARESHDAAQEQHSASQTAEG